MNYIITEKNEAKKSVTYRVLVKKLPAADFSYYIEPLRNSCSPPENSFAYAQSSNRFWISEIRLNSGFDQYETLDAVIHFIQYKCRTAGYREMYIRLNARNLFYLELYKKYGFSIIASEQTPLSGGNTDHDYILKYTVPDTAEELYRGYIKRNGQ